jgi:hypothetical protein
MSNDNCALGKDGQLLDAAEIEWFNDPDDAKPMNVATSSSAAQPASVSALSTSTSTPQNVFDLLGYKATPAISVAGSRRKSGRVSRPTAKARWAAEAEEENFPVMTSKGKGKRVASASPPQASHRRHISHHSSSPAASDKASDNNAEDSNGYEPELNDGEATEPTSDAEDGITYTEVLEFSAADAVCISFYCASFLVSSP